MLSLEFKHHCQSQLTNNSLSWLRNILSSPHGWSLQQCMIFLTMICTITVSSTISGKSLLAILRLSVTSIVHSHLMLLMLVQFSNCNIYFRDQVSNGNQSVLCMHELLSSEECVWADIITYAPRVITISQIHFWLAIVLFFDDEVCWVVAMQLNYFIAKCINNMFGLIVV